MKSAFVTNFTNCCKDQRGQIIPWLGFMMLGFFGFTGLVIDVGRAYVAHSQLQISTNAAALAASGIVWDSDSTSGASTLATQYSGSAGDLNAAPSLGTVTTTVNTTCVALLLGSGQSCSTSPANAVQVTETATIRTFFMPILFGPKTITVTAVGMASLLGQAQPWNVAVILDATGSMGTDDSDCGGITEFQCALNGVETMLENVNPCAPGYTSCASSNAYFHVSLFTFPGISTSTVDDEYSCSGTPAFMAFTLPLTTSTSYTPLEYTVSSGSHKNQTWTATYQVTSFSSDYYNPSSSNKLSSTSDTVKALNGCMQYIKSAGTGVGDISGSQGGVTYYASVMYAAQAALDAEYAALSPSIPGLRNAMILLSDGQANAFTYNKAQPAGMFPSDIPSTLTSGFSGYSTLGGNGTGIYPDWHDECQQAITAAQTITAAGTRVYAVAYGSESSGCTGSSGTDSTLVATGNNQAFTLSTLTPCITMENIASSLNYFYSDWTQSGSGSTCQDNSHSVEKMNDIFQAIAGTFTTPRLLPYNAAT